jgi:hypothetical protein
MNEEPREPLGNTIHRNVFVDCTKQVCSFDGNVKKLLDKFEIADNLAVNTTGAVADMAKPVEFKGFANLAGTADKPIDLGLDDRAAPDFSVRWQTWIRKEIPSFETIPFENIGLYQDEYRRTLPPR